MRQHARRTTQLQLRYYGFGMPDHETGDLRNVSLSGLSFKSRYNFQKGSHLQVDIPLTKPGFFSKAYVVWCHHSDSFYEVGIKFHDEYSESQKLMFEQICLIENYRSEVIKNQGRNISSDEAAEEWLSRLNDDTSC